LIERGGLEACGVGTHDAMMNKSNEMFVKESDDEDDADIIQNVLSVDWMSSVQYSVGIWKPPDDEEKDFEKFVKVHWKCNNSGQKT